MSDVRLGLRDNVAQFSLLVVVNAFVGAMVGLERSSLPVIGESDFGVSSATAVLSYIVAFGIAKAVTNLAAGMLAERVGRRRLLIAGWACALPVPLLLFVADSWAVVVGANVLLGVSQGLAWSMTVLMKIDLVGPHQRGTALGLNEAAGYLGVAVAAALTGWLGAHYAPRDVLVVTGAVVAVAGFVLSVAFVRDTAAHVALEQRDHIRDASTPRLAQAFVDGTWRRPELRACSQAGLVNNMGDGLAWGLVPLFLAAHGASVEDIGLIAGLYPAVWGVGQLGTGAWSDRIGRRPLIVTGMLAQAAALLLLAASAGRMMPAAAAAVLLGGGTALVYPTLIAAIGDHTTPVGRAAAIGVYRFWRDSGYAVGALLSGFVSDWLGMGPAIVAVAVLTAASGVWAAADLPAPLPVSANSSDGVQLTKP